MCDLYLSSDVSLFPYVIYTPFVSLKTTSPQRSVQIVDHLFYIMKKRFNFNMKHWVYRRLVYMIDRSVRIKDFKYLRIIFVYLQVFVRFLVVCVIE